MLEEKFQRYIREHALVEPDDRILLTVSGGVDSMVMMDLFVSAGYKVGVAHCNFQLRGEESDEDETLVQMRAAGYGLPSSTAGSTRRAKWKPPENRYR
jgi:tRNA(Ile)-lysidine synthase